jgi:hypothetical protein
MAGKKIVVASMDPDSKEEKWVYKNGFKEKPGPKRSAYAESITRLLRQNNYEVIEDWGPSYGRNKPNDDIGLVMAMHGLRGVDCWADRFNYLDSLCPNVWCLMGSHLNDDYVIYDRLGYSGGNSFAQDPTLWGDIAKADLDQAKKLHSQLANKYIAGNQSKYDQPDKTDFESEPFVAVLGQVSGDSSTYFTNFKGEQINHNHANYSRTMWIALNELNKWGVKILYKSHPREYGTWSWNVREIIKSGIWPNVSIVDDVGIHQLFDKSQGAVTINSGAGFEALLHLKPVVTLGKVDYSVATFNCSDTEDIAKAKDFVLMPQSSVNYREHQTFIKKFLLRHHEERAITYRNPDINPYLDAVRKILGPEVAREQYGDRFNEG